MSQPLHYIIFHPERKEYEASGEAVVLGRQVVNWRGIVWTDPFRRKAGSNEDPFVWGSEEWLYSFCHASQLRRKPSSTEPHVMAGSYIFFCETPAAKLHDTLKLDTVFVVSRVEHWMSPGRAVPARYTHHQKAGQSEAWLRHFRHGMRPLNMKRHVGEYAYAAVTNGVSYLPLGKDGLPVSLAIASVLPSRLDNVKKAVPQAQSTYL